MADKKVARIVVHPKLNLSVGGKLQRMKVGAEIMLTPEAAKRLDELGRTRDPKKAPAVEVDGGKPKSKDREKAEAALDKRQKALDKARETKNMSDEQKAALDTAQANIDTERAALED